MRQWRADRKELDQLITQVMRTGHTEEAKRALQQLLDAGG